MNKRLLLLASLSLFLSRPALSQDPTFEEQSLAAFRSADLAMIEHLHCPAYESDRSNAQAAFGCFFVRILRVLESWPFTRTLVLLGEPAVNLQRDVFDPANPDALCTKLGREAIPEGDQSWFQEFPNLPFNNYRFGSLGAFGRELLIRLRNSGRNAGSSLQRMRNYLWNLDGLLNPLIDMLAVAKNTPDFSFTIPREICPVHSTRMRDIVVRNIDLEGFHAALGSVKVFVNLIGSYMTGLNPYWFASANGDIMERRFVENANGVRPNRMKFAERMRGRQDVSFLEPLVRSTLDSFILLIDSVHSEEDSYVFGHFLNNSWWYRHQSYGFPTSWKHYAQDLKDSLDHPDVFWPMIESGNEGIQINASAFLRSLPNPADITSADPFVVGGASTPPRRTDRLSIRFVPQFFRDLFANFAAF